jgi:hypothetical protein
MVKHASWIGWSILTAGLVGYLVYSLLNETGLDAVASRWVFLPAGTTAGHHQIELACETCHTPFQGVKQDACLGCHAEELKLAEDSHPKRKFTDPRNTNRVALLDARLCTTCHREHKPEITKPMGVSQPDDFCLLCHCDIGEERPSHADIEFDTCASAGCHNYHDNRALYEDFLVKHLYETQGGPKPLVPKRNLAEIQRLLANKPLARITLAEHDAPAEISVASTVMRDWEATAHAAAGVNCMDCHGTERDGDKRTLWETQVTQESCRECHAEQVNSFLVSKHGMRLKEKLPPMRPALARLAMKSKAYDRELGCMSCHRAHRFDTRDAAVDACLACHDDTHSLAYRNSPHGRLWQAELNGRGEAGSGVSCASCHLPRETRRREGHDATWVQHNQNDSLRPNEKMLRSVCLMCHGLGFSIDALADPSLIGNNFQGVPTSHVKSLDWAEVRFKQGLKRNKSKQPKFKPFTCDPKRARPSNKGGATS